MPSSSPQPLPAAEPAPSAGTSQIAELRLVRALRAGDDRAFEQLVERHGPAMRRIARGFVASDAVADEIVQETWVAVLAGIDRFEQRSSLRTWIFQILVNRAKTQGVKDRRTVPLSALDAREEGPVVGAERFFGPDAKWPGHWSMPPRPWQHPDRRVLSLEARERLRAALELLPSRQQQVVTMRDVEGMSAGEVCDLLDVSPENQRVLLHRGRSQLRGVLESYVEATA